MVKKKNNRKKKIVQPQRKSAYKRFVQDIDALYNKLGNIAFHFKAERLQKMFQLNACVKPPTAGNDLVTEEELRAICNKAKDLYKTQSYECKAGFLSAYETQLLFLIFLGLSEEFTELYSIHDPRTIHAEEMKDRMMKEFALELMSNYLTMLSRLSRPDLKVFSSDLHFVRSPNPCRPVEIHITVYAATPELIHLPIQGVRRPVFRLGLSASQKEYLWQEVDTEKLAGMYRGKLSKLPVYMQSHALRRMKERLDLLDQPALNYTLWDSCSSEGTGFVYKTCYLIPVYVHEIRVGYFAGSIIDNKLVLRTFLFITHSATPEGDKLNELTGLGKSDIKYWRIDRLSTFMQVDKDEYPELLELMDRAGLDDLGSLRNKTFDTDSLQSVNLNGLTDYIAKGYQNFFANEYSIMNPDQLEAVPICTVK